MRNFVNTKKVFTELAGLYYAAQYADNYLINGNGTVYIFKTGHIYDIAVVPKIETDNITSIKDNAEYFIEAKGMKNTRPTSCRVGGTYKKLTDEIRKKYWFYVIYNIGFNKKPGLAIFDWTTYLKLSHLAYDRTFHILGVAQGIKNGLITDHPNFFNNLDTQNQNLILQSFREGKMIGDIKQFSNLTKQNVINNYKVPIVQERSNAMKYSREEIYDDFLKYVRSLEPNIPEEQQQQRLTFSSISNRTGRPLTLCWIKRHKYVGWTIHVRKESLQYKYPENINKISGYVPGEKSSSFGLPYFKICNIDDLTNAKIIIKFAYDRL